MTGEWPLRRFRLVSTLTFSSDHRRRRRAGFWPQPSLESDLPSSELLRNYFFTRALSITYGSTVPYLFDPRIAGRLLLTHSCVCTFVRLQTCVCDAEERCNPLIRPKSLRVCSYFSNWCGPVRGAASTHGDSSTDRGFPTAGIASRISRHDRARSRDAIG
jgi:hypothetical protein